MQEEIKRLKNIKKEEILDRIKKIQNVGGKKEINRNKIQSIIDEDFDPEKFNHKMNEEFGEEFYEEEEPESE